MTAVSDFFVGKLDLPRILRDLPEELFAKEASKGSEDSDELKRGDGHYEDGEFDA